MTSWELHQGDSLELLKEIKSQSIDGIVTDPPFTFGGGNSKGQTGKVNNQFFLHWWKDVCRELNRILKPEGEGFLWCDWKSAPTFADGFTEDQKRVWRVAQVTYHYRQMIGMGKPFRSSVDMIAYLRGPKSDGHRIPSNTENWISKYWYYGKHKYHPAEKSVEVAKQLLEWCSDEGMIIIDPFMGSGTVGEACLLLRRNFIGIEIDKDYYNVANERLNKVSDNLQTLKNYKKG